MVAIVGALFRIPGKDPQDIPKSWSINIAKTLGMQIG